MPSLWASGYSEDYARLWIQKAYSLIQQSFVFSILSPLEMMLTFQLDISFWYPPEGTEGTSQIFLIGDGLCELFKYLLNCDIKTIFLKFGKAL